MATRHLRRLVAERRDEIEQIARAHGVTRIRLVGSVAHGDNASTSDIDFRVRLEPGRSRFDQAGLAHDLEELLGVDVEVISDGGLRSTDQSLLNDTIELANEPASRPQPRRDRDQRLDDLAEISEEAGLYADDVTRTRLRH